MPTIAQPLPMLMYCFPPCRPTQDEQLEHINLKIDVVWLFLARWIILKRLGQLEVNNHHWYNIYSSVMSEKMTWRRWGSNYSIQTSAVNFKQRKYNWTFKPWISKNKEKAHLWRVFQKRKSRRRTDRREANQWFTSEGLKPRNASFKHWVTRRHKLGHHIVLPSCH